jgi:hypothetical protein
MVNQVLVALVLPIPLQVLLLPTQAAVEVVKQTNPHLAQEVLGVVVLAAYCLQMEIPEQPI